MMKKRHKGISVMSAQVTATVSVTLVLLLLGITAILGTVTRNLTDTIRENLGFNIVLADSVAPSSLNAMIRRLADEPYVSSYKYISAQDALDNWRSMTGEDLMEVLDVNPFSSVVEVKVKSDYANPDSIAKVTAIYSNHPDIEKVEVPTVLVESISRSIRSVTLGLSAVAILLLIISFVLINNTIHLTVYARRFTIYTMQLVGATNGFIRRPFIAAAMLAGLIAGVVADGLLALALSYLHGLDAEVRAAMSWDSVAWVFVVVPFVGMIINALAAELATYRYLRKNYDEMFS